MLSVSPQPYWPSSAASATRSTITTIKRGFHSSIALSLQSNGDARHPEYSGFGAAGGITRWSDRAVPAVYPPKGIAVSRLGKRSLGERPPAPRELAAVPPGQRGERDAGAGGMDEPAVAQVDPRVPDLRRGGPRPAVAEEDHVCRLELREGDPLRCADLAAHLVRRAAAERGGKRP